MWGMLGKRETHGKIDPAFAEGGVVDNRLKMLFVVSALEAYVRMCCTVLY